MHVAKTLVQASSSIYSYRTLSHPPSLPNHSITNPRTSSQVRGLATNVANYNAWSVTTCASYTQGDSNCDEKKYINALAPLLTAAGYPAHFIIDTCRHFKFPIHITS